MFPFPMMFIETPVNVADVFNSSIYTGTGASKKITTNTNISANGGMLWGKSRSNAGYNHLLFDTGRGVTHLFKPDTANADDTSANSLTSFDTDGFTLGTDAATNLINQNGVTYVAWSWVQRNEFFKMSEVVVSGSNQTVDLATLGAVGMVLVKGTASSYWLVLHRSGTAGKLVFLDQTAAEATDGSITLSGTTLTLVQSVIGNGTYEVYAFAHRPAGVIQCVGFSTDGSGNGSVDTGWASGVQFVNLKCLTAVESWEQYDTARTSGFSGNDARLLPDDPAAEDSVARLSFSGTTLSFAGLSASQSYICMLIKAP